jgi:hypothetical protein
MINHSPTLRRRRLAKLLNELRDQAGLTAEEAADQLRKSGGRWSKSKISRIEDPRYPAPSVRDVRDILDLYSVQDLSQREAFVQLVADAGQQGWWTAYKDVLAGSYVDFEAEASSIRTFEPLVIPGLLQTPAYCAEIIRSSLVPAPAEIERRTGLRMKRQEILQRPNPPQLWAVLDEAALRHPATNPDVRREQLQWLIDTGPMEHVTIQVLPSSAGPHPGLAGQFVILDFIEPLDPSIVYIETGTDGLYLERQEELARYTLIFQHLSAIALSPDASIRFIGDLVDQPG